jgi:hypothetical protein
VWREAEAFAVVNSMEQADETLSNCSNLSESLFEGSEDEENQPPNFVPETPAATSDMRVSTVQYLLTY